MYQDRNKAWGFSLFGDDIRQEAGGKLSLMGIYQDDMIFPNTLSFPAIVPKFVVFILYYEVKDALQEDIIFKVSLDTETNVIAQSTVLRKDVPSLKEPIGDSTSELGEERIFHARMPILLSPFVIEKVGRLRVRAHYSDDKILKLGSLHIKVLPPPELQEVGTSQAQQPAKAD